jgi:Domain of unknown function (DUF4333)
VIHRAAPAALALSAVALGGCGNSVDRKDLESKIADYVQQHTGASIDVHCPDGVKADEGTKVRCTTELSGAPADIDVVFGKDGHVRITRTRVRNPGL